MRTKDDVFNDLRDLVWTHFVAMDSQGNTDHRRDVEQTTRHWTAYHDLTTEMLKLRYKESQVKLLFRLQLIAYGLLIIVATIIGYSAGRYGWF